MSLETASRHDDGFVIKAEIRIPGDPAVKNDFMVDGNIRSQISVNDEKEKKNDQFNTGRRKKQFKKMNEFCFEL